jgi:hypothetical protein
VALFVTMGSLLLVTPVLFLFGALATINSDACSSRPSLPICSPGIQRLVAYLPGGGAFAGLVVGQWPHRFTRCR